MNLQNLSQEELRELQELMQLKKEGRLKVKGEVKSRNELLAYNHFRQNRLNHYVNSMYNTLKENGLIEDVKKFPKSLSSYIENITNQLEVNPDAKISKGTKASLPDFAIFDKNE